MASCARISAVSAQRRFRFTAVRLPLVVLGFGFPLTADLGFGLALAFAFGLAFAFAFGLAFALVLALVLALGFDFDLPLEPIVAAVNAAIERNKQSW